MNEEEKIKIYEKTPIFKTIGHLLLLSEATTMIYSTVNSSKPLMEFINIHKKLYHSVLPYYNSIIDYTINHDIKSGLIGASILMGASFSAFYINKFREYKPKVAKYEKELDYFLEYHIEYMHERIKLPGYLIAGVTTLTSLFSGTSNSFFQNNLNLFRHTSQVVDNYSSLFVPIATMVAVYSSKPFVTYTLNFLRGIYEKAYMFYDSLKEKVNISQPQPEEKISSESLKDVPVVKIEKTIDLKTGINLYYFNKYETQKEVIAYIRNDISLDPEHKITPFLNEDVVKYEKDYFYFPGSKGKVDESTILDVKGEILESIKSSPLEKDKIRAMENKVNSKSNGNNGKKETIKK
jgi:hypothetical protein